MKNIILAFGLVCIMLVMIVGVSTVEVDSNKEQALVENVRLAAYQTVKECSDEDTWRGLCLKQGDGMSDAERMSQSFRENLKGLLQTEDKIEVRFLKTDREKGILSVEVRRTYQNWGKEKQVSTEETVLRNESISEDKNN